MSTYGYGGTPGGFVVNSLLFWILLLFAFYVMYALGARSGIRRGAAITMQAPPTIPTDKLAACEAKLAPLMMITGHRVLGEILEFEGQLRGKTDEVFGRIREVFAGEAVTPLLLEGDNNDARVVVLPGAQSARAAERPRWAIHWLLFIATLATTTWAGALHAGVNLLQHPGLFTVGLPYSLGLLLILGAHELGHYFTAKAHGIRVTPPYFIPVPFALGTLARL